MLTSEETARTKTCPRTVTAVMDMSHAEIVMRGGPCIASECMAWRWGDDSGRMDRRGFCGLAGRPEAGIR